MKNELFVLAKMAVALTVVDAFVPRAETMARSRMDHRQKQEEQSNSEPKHQHQEFPHYGRPASSLTEMHMGLFDMNPFHGSGSGGTKEALDEQWEVQQEILRARRGEKGHLVKKRSVELKPAPAKKKVVQIKSAKTGANIDVDVDDAAHHHHQSNKPKFFWDLGKKH